MNEQEPENLISAIEDDPIAQQLPPRPTFIPLRHADLRLKLREYFSFSAIDQDSFDQLCNHLQAIFHVEHLSLLLQLEEIYSHLDPDSEYLELEDLDAAKRDHLSEKLVDQVTSLLFSAHYKQLTRTELEAAIEIGCQWGVRLDVDFELFHQLEIFARGYRTVTITRRRWQNLFREESIELPEFQRLIMVFRTRPIEAGEIKNRADQPIDPNRVYLKTFKNIPETDLEILLPGSRVRLSRFDKAKIILPTLSGTVITAYKLFRSLLVLSVAFTFNAIFGWLVFIGVSGGYIVKSFFSYFRTKNKYQFGLTKSLYLKNMDNNLSVIYRILNEAEEQELCEAILAYAILWKHKDVDPEGATSEQLDRFAEKFLVDVTELDVDFEIDDALGKLARLGMANVDAMGRWKAVEISNAIESLNSNWKKLFKAKTGIGTVVPPTHNDLFTS